MQRILQKIVVFCALFAMIGCEKKMNMPSGPIPQGATQTDPASGKLVLNLLSGTENKDLIGKVALLKKFENDNNVQFNVTYKGSVDGMMELKQGANAPYDIVWISSDLWLNLGDTQHVVKNAKSTMNSPVVFAVKKSKAKELGWVDNPNVKIADILSAVTSSKIRFAMTSATQSNTGASQLFGFYSSMAGSPEILTIDHLKDAKLQDQTAQLTKAVRHPFSSSSYLADDLVANPQKYDSMVNYEALVISANTQLIAAGREPLYVIYPADGLLIANFPMGFISHGDAAKSALFTKLQAYLDSESVQKQLLDRGRRTQVLGINPGTADKQVFNPEWGIDVSRVLTPISIPNTDVIEYGLRLYQTSLRAPSLTVFVLDYSGSMTGKDGGVKTREEQLEEAMSLLLEPEEAKEYFLDVAPKDITAIFTYSDGVDSVIEVKGNDPALLRSALQKVLARSAHGSTFTHTALNAAYDYLVTHKTDLTDHAPAVILMTDGEANDSAESFKDKVTALGLRNDVPLYAIRFGEANETQLKDLVTFVSGKYYDGSKGLVPVFREVKGNN